jgi:transcriptional regulator with XRE-family HTH domain
MFNYTHFSKRLQATRINYSLTIESLSKLTGIPAATLQGYESQSMIVDIEDLVKIADVFDVSLDYIVRQSIP